jgi:rhamnose transport system ATP-binding protein
MPAPILKAVSISKSYAGVHALRNVSFDLCAGEVHALIGENGAGKSTLIRILAGAVVADSGSIEMDGRVVEHNDPLTAKTHGIAAIYQQPALFPDLTVAENIAMGAERGGLWRRVDWPARRRRATELLARIGATVDPNALAGDLSLPQQQMVEIARALGADAKVLILDEPTPSLTNHEVENLFRVIRGLREHGVALIYISHRLEELAAIADRVTVLRDGAYIGTYQMPSVTRQSLIQLMVGRELSTVFPKRSVPLGAVRFEARNLGCRKAGIHGVNFSVRAGEILGLAGLVGSGRTQLAEVLFGLSPADSGEILLDGRQVRIPSARRAIELGIGHVPEDRRRHGLIMPMPIAANTTLADLKAVSQRGFLDFRKENAIAERFVQKLGVKTASIQDAVEKLSGGNQQKVSLSRWLALDPGVIILDEPTQGVDVGAKAEIHALLCDLAERGLAILMISSELPEILGMSDRIAVMHAGAIAGVLDRSDASQEKILAMALGSAA